MRGYGFSKFTPRQIPKGGFDELLKLFLELLNYTAGDAGEALAWMNELDKQYNVTNDEYGMGDFIDELKQKGYLDEDKDNGEFQYHCENRAKHPAVGAGRNFRETEKSGKGNHRSPQSGQGDEKNAERREYEFGDSLDQIDMTQSIHNAQINHGIGDFMMTERDLEVEEMDYKTLTSTVLMIDISHSMIFMARTVLLRRKKWRWLWLN